MPDATVLDDPEARAKLDPGGMAKAVRELPEQCREAWNEARRLELPPHYREIDRIVILGMGGSAIAGDVFRLLLARECAVPVLNHRHYDLPPYVDGRTLLIASSYSGDTEETVSAFGQGLATAAKKLAITTGGRLLTAARANGVPAFVFRYQGEPRAAFGYGLMPLLAVAEALALMQGVDRDVEEAIAAMESLRERIGEDAPLAANPAKQLAARLAGRLPVVYGAELLTEVAHRWKTQLNESTKVWSFYEQLPEANHNAIVSSSLPPEVAGLVTAVYLRSPHLHPRVSLQYEFSQRALAEAGVDHLEAQVEGRSALAQVLTGVLLGDYVSFYLALLNGVDPTPTTIIDNLKAWLAQQK
ncbi:MAG: bifunctional phosphoglucose/phosphomannose isomerase [Dehalococcoidia bacterium]|nr:bifunctional phosphoglucose/phosphomannose isomerase [Dehalococcoidia bacterium]